MAWSTLLMFLFPLWALFNLISGVINIFNFHPFSAIFSILFAVVLVITTIHLKKQSKYGYYLAIAVVYIPCIFNIIHFDLINLIISLFIAICNTNYFYRRRNIYGA